MNLHASRGLFYSQIDRVIPRFWLILFLVEKYFKHSRMTSAPRKFGVDRRIRIFIEIVIFDSSYQKFGSLDILEAPEVSELATLIQWATMWNRMIED